MSDQKNTALTIGEMVANDFRAASVFKEAGIDSAAVATKAWPQPASKPAPTKASFQLNYRNLHKLHHPQI